MNLNVLQTTINLQKHLMNHGKTMKDVENFLRIDYQEWFQKRECLIEKQPKCPECETSMLLLEVNTDLSNQIGDGYTGVWFCPNCDHDEYIKDDISEWIVDLYNTEMGKILGAFSFDDLENALEITQKTGDSTAEWQKKAIKCPECGFIMRLFSISNNECHWICQNCRFSIYKPHSIKKEKKEIGFEEP